MKILIIGGTLFLGRHLVDAAQKRNHELTLFNRGQTHPGLFPEIETIRGDRETDLHKLANRQWDAVIDTCGYVPRVVRLSANALRDSVERYVFISSVLRYRDFDLIGIDETYPTATLKDEGSEDVDSFYGPLKALCERTVEAIFSKRALNIIPGFIAGPFDQLDNFTFWPVRVARGGDILAPVGPEEPVQFIDVRDLSEWIIRLVEAKAAGTFNVNGPATLTFGQLLDACQQACTSEAHIHWAPTDFLNQQGVTEWSDLPLWIPFMGIGAVRFNINKALAAGLTFRPLMQTARDTLEWALSRPSNYELKAGISAEKEGKIIAALKSHF